MPTHYGWYDYGQGDAPRLRAWSDHYKRKGCSSPKANELARRKRFKRTWPPV